MNLIIFDMDGTLVNSGYAIANTVNFVRENLGFEKMEKDFILENVNDPKINSAEFFYGTKEFTTKQGKLFEEYYNNNCLTDLVIYDGIKDLLENLKGDFKLAVATNANSIYAQKMLSHLEINKYFSSILGYNDVLKPKPNPDMVNKILDIHNIKKQNAQLVGDSHKDIMAASKAGIDSVLVNWGFSNHTQDAIDTVCQLEKRIQAKFFIS